MYGQNNSNQPNSQRITQATNYLANQLSKNNISELTADEITYIQTYLEQVKKQKVAPLPARGVHEEREFRQAPPLIQPLSNQNPVCTNLKQLQQEKIHDSRFMTDINRVPITTTRFGKKSVNNDYYNPYEYGSKQNALPSTFDNRSNYVGPYERTPDMYGSTPDMYGSMGLTTNAAAEKFPGHVRNVNIESALIQQETTHLPGQRANTSSTETNRFELLPFDPQDTTHIVWTDGMPRGGYPSRNDRLELS